MKYRALESFRNNFRRLPAGHQQAFLQILREFFLPAIEAGSFTGTPKRLRIHRITNTKIYSLTCPDGRATFHLDKLDEGETLLVWRRVGDHAIYKNP